MIRTILSADQGGTVAGSDSNDTDVFPREEVEAAFQEFRRRGEEAHDWEAWADMFTEDALYEEHYLGTFHGREQIRDFITSTMKDYTGSSFWLEWYFIDGNRVSMYLWNNWADPEGKAAIRLPQHDIPRVRRWRQVQVEPTTTTPTMRARLQVGLDAGGGGSTPPDHTLKGTTIGRHSHQRPRILATMAHEFLRYRERA